MYVCQMKWMQIILKKFFFVFFIFHVGCQAHGSRRFVVCVRIYVRLKSMVYYVVLVKSCGIFNVHFIRPQPVLQKVPYEQDALFDGI